MDERWRGLRSNLAGLFCASLGSMDEQRTTSPSLTFLPEGDLPPSMTYQLRHGTLPSENVCTENLTPFLKLLPCKSLSGIASLLNPHRLFDADWHGMGIHVRYIENMGVEVRLTFQGVFNPVRYSTDGRRGTSRRCFDDHAADRHPVDWSLQSIFDRSIQRTCPVAHRSEIRVLSTSDDAEITPTPDALNPTYVAYDVNTG